MSATLPTDLKRATWKKIKPVLMKKTGFGEALEAYEKKRTALLAKRSLAGFASIHEDIATLVTAKNAAVTIAKAGKYKDCIESLEGYTGLIAAEANSMMASKAKYQLLIDAWIKVRKDCIAGMEKHEVDMKDLGLKIDATVKVVDKMKGKEVATPVINQAATLVDKDLRALDDLQKTYIATCKLVREAPTTEVHADDRPTEYLVTLNKIQSGLEGDYKIKKSELNKAATVLKDMKG